MKPWIFYMIVAWQTMPGPLAPTEQTTIILEFDHKSECLSIADQVVKQIKHRGVPLMIKQLSCFECLSIYRKDQCRSPVVLKKK